MRRVHVNTELHLRIKSVQDMLNRTIQIRPRMLELRWDHNLGSKLTWRSKA